MTGPAAVKEWSQPGLERLSQAARRPVLAWIGNSTLLVVLFIALVLLHRATAPGAGIEIHEAEFIASEASVPPNAAAGWVRRTLPDDWNRSRPGVDQGWYRLYVRLSPPEGQERWAIYLPSLSMNAAAYLNGAFVGDGGRFDEPVSRNFLRPLLFAVEPWLLVAGDNVIHLRLKSDMIDEGLLDRVWVGRERDLGPAYARRYALKVTALWGITAVLFLTALFMGGFSLARRSEAPYRWSALALGLWAVFHLNFLIVDIPIPTRAWRWVWETSAVWFALVVIRLAGEMVAEEPEAWPHALVVYGLPASAALVALANSSSQPWALTAPFTLLFLAAPYPVYRIARAFRQRSLREVGHDLGRPREEVEADVRALFSVGLFVVACGAHDWMAQADLLDRAEGCYFPYSAVVVLGAAGWVMLRQFVTALRRSEALAADLDRRIEETRRDLERSDERRREMDRKRLLAEERERIMREMHDGLGSHLVSTLALVESDIPMAAVGEAVRGTLDDLRLMVEALEPADPDLLPALGQLRSRLQPRLEAAGLSVEWRAGEIPPVEGFGPGKVLQVLRIVEEAVTNVLKHANARTLAIRTALTETGDGAPAVSIEVADDGRGIGEAPSHGLGMDNMRRRAQEIGAVLDVRSSSAGTVVGLYIPLGEAR